MISSSLKVAGNSSISASDIGARGFNAEYFSSILRALSSFVVGPVNLEAPLFDIIRPVTSLNSFCANSSSNSSPSVVVLAFFGLVGLVPGDSAAAGDGLRDSSF